MRQISKAPSEVFSFVVPSRGGRLDQVLAHEEAIKSRTVAQKMITSRLVTVNGVVATKASFAVAIGDRIEVTLPSSAPVSIDSSKKSTTLPILYEDDFCFVINKPAGVVVHPGSGMKTREETVLSALKPLFAKWKLPFSEGEVLVHRLDKDTTGCMLIAKTPKAHLFLQKQFAERTVKKTYIALAYGRPHEKTATIDAPIGRHGTLRTKMSIHQAVRSRSAQTTYRTLVWGHGVSLLECDLHTGRTHQIRVHLASIGHPVLGDPTYGSNASKELSLSLGVQQLLLHAKHLEFQSPSKKCVIVEAPLPKKFLQTLDRVGLEETGKL